VIAPKEPVLKRDQFLRQDGAPAIDRAYQQAAAAGWTPAAKAGYAKAANRADRRAMSQAARVVFNDPTATAQQRSRARVLMVAIAGAR
jgi:hypothetical protein